MIDEVFRADQALFFGAEVDEEQRPAQGGLALAEDSRQLDHRGRAGGVVIGAGVDLVRIGRAAAEAAVAEMVVVGADDDVLVGVPAVAGKAGDDVLEVIGDAIEGDIAFDADFAEGEGARGELLVDLGLEGACRSRAPARERSWLAMRCLIWMTGIGERSDTPRDMGTMGEL